MAIDAASGYGQFPNGNWSPTIWSKNVLLALKKSSIVDEITNTDYSGEIKAYGDSVKILRQPIVTITDYKRGEKTEPQELVDEGLTLVIDQAKKYKYYIDDVEEALSHIDWQDLVQDGASYALKDDYDLNVFTYMAANVTAPADLTGVTIGYAGGSQKTPLDIIAAAERDLNQANIPMDGQRYFVISPQFKEYLTKEDAKFINANEMGTSKSAVLDQRLAFNVQVHGFKLYMSNNLPANTLLYGHKGGVATANSLVKMRSLPDPDRFGMIYDGLHVYGRKVLRSEAARKVTITAYA